MRTLKRGKEKCSWRPVLLAGWALCSLALPAGGQSPTAAPPVPPGRVLIEPLDYRGVTLDGVLRRQVEEVRDWYLRIPNDDLLKGFRARAGRPAPGVDLGGWYSTDTFHIFGQIVSGLARMYAATGDPACREKVDALVHEWGQCIRPDGFCFFSDAPAFPHYNYEKIVCGLVDAARYCDNREAPELLARITDWAEKKLDRTNTYTFSTLSNAAEWYTLGENLDRAYLLTGQERYRDFARKWEYTAYWDVFAGKGRLFEGQGQAGYHAYSHVNTLCGAGAAYLATGGQRYLEIIRNGYEYIQKAQVFATGGYGPNECFLPRDILLDGLLTGDNHFETQCGCWAAFKLSKYLMSCTGEARYGDWIERLVINGIGASTPSTPDGRVFYYANYNPGGGSKSLFDFHWSCCVGTRIQATADYHDLIYFRDADGLYVNLFAPSEVKTRIHDREVVLRQETRFPERPVTEVAVSVPEPLEFALRIRKPGWLAGPLKAAVNGESVEASVDSRGWASIRRTWKSGDRVRVELPMRFWSSRFPPDSDKPYPAAVLYGPVVLALRSAAGNPSRKVDFAQLDRAFVPSPGEPLTYHLTADPSVLARPFYAYQQGEPYYLYLDPSDPSVWVPARNLGLKAPWKDINLGLWTTREAGATLSYEFQGTGIRWAGRLFDDAGTAEVRLDDKTVATVDQYGPSRGLPFSWETRDLTCGRHTLTLTLKPEKNKDSKDTYINIAGLAVLGGDCSAGARTYRNPIINRTGPADPTVIRHGGKYYLYPTWDCKGYDVFVSEDLVRWERKGKCFADARGGVWAPDVFHDAKGSGGFYLYYTVDNPGGGKLIGVAVSPDPLGPFADQGTLVKDAIDAHVFQDDDGKLYFYYCDLSAGPNRVVMRTMSDPRTLNGEPIVLISPTDEWEKLGGPVAEGPWMLKHKGVYYLMYSGSGASTPHYAIGYATAKSPLGPFTKHPGNPIAKRGNGVFGPGHHCVVTGPDGKLWMVYHQKRNEGDNWQRFLAIDPLWFDEQGVIHTKTTCGTTQPAP